MEWLEGKRTYLVAFVAALVALLQGGFGVEIPEWANYLLGALGITTLRAALK
jgi:hypothetical protein